MISVLDLNIRFETKLHLKQFKANRVLGYNYLQNCIKTLSNL